MTEMWGRKVCVIISLRNPSDRSTRGSQKFLGRCDRYRPISRAVLLTMREKMGSENFKPGGFDT